MAKYIPGGFYMKARCIQESWVAHAAPVVRETWDYLLMAANHKDKKYMGFIVKRGQLFRSYTDIRDALKWQVGYRFERYSESSMKRAMKLLREGGMIELTSEPRGNLITVVNYDYYQTVENYERTDEQTDERTSSGPVADRHRPAINKNEKNEKNVNTIGKKNFQKLYTAVEKFEPNSREETIAKDIAEQLGEKTINFVLAAVKKHGTAAAQRAAVAVAESKNVKNPGRLFNHLIKQFSDEAI